MSDIFRGFDELIKEHIQKFEAKKEAELRESITKELMQGSTNVAVLAAIKDLSDKIDYVAELLQKPQAPYVIERPAKPERAKTEEEIEASPEYKEWIDFNEGKKLPPLVHDFPRQPKTPSHLPKLSPIVKLSPQRPPHRSGRYRSIYTESPKPTITPPKLIHTKADGSQEEMTIKEAAELAVKEEAVLAPDEPQKFDFGNTVKLSDIHIFLKAKLQEFQDENPNSKQPNKDAMRWLSTICNANERAVYNWIGEHNFPRESVLRRLEEKFNVEIDRDK